MPNSAAKSSSLYDVHPGVAMVQKWIDDLKPKTGRSLEEWIALTKKDGPKDYRSRRAWLKSRHKLGTNSAWWIAARAEGKGTEEDTPEKYLATAMRYLEDQYAGKRSALLAMYIELLQLAKSLGPDVKACPCKTMVPLYREHVFAQIKPTTISRIDLGLCFTSYKGKLPKRLIDSDLKKWLRAAYDLNP